MRLELDQLKAETEAIKAEARSTNDDAISDLARSGSEAKRKNEQQVEKLVRAAIHRQKKT